MTTSLIRFAIPCLPLRLPAHPRRFLTSPRPVQKSGRNLGLRYQQLESSIRSTARKATILEEMVDNSRSVENYGSVLVHNKSRVPHEEIEVFCGLAVPKEPKPPEPDECCMSGCAVCVYDLYEDSLLTYRASLASLRTQLKSMGIPKAEWPSRIKPSPNSQVIERASNTSLDAFEAMEKALEAKQQGRTQGGS